MRFSFPLTLGARTLAPIAFALLLVGLGGGCEEKHVGRPCSLGIAADAVSDTQRLHYVCTHQGGIVARPRVHLSGRSNGAQVALSFCE